jgi:methionyl-tRNA formyltransferase
LEAALPSVTPLRLIMMGTGPFAAPTFRALFDTRHRVVGLVTQPLRGARGRQDAPPSPLRSIATQLAVPILDPPSINEPEAQETLRRLQPELFIVADYGQILSPETLAIARLGGLNLHGSLLPKYRGAAPINWAIYRGETETGVTIIHMTPALDAGPCLVQSRTSIAPDETAAELEPRLAELGAPLVCQTIDALQAGQAQPIPQDPALVTKARRLRKTDGEIDWRRSAQQIKNQVRAMQPWPGCYTFWHRPDGPAVRLIVGRVAVCPSLVAAEPGSVLEAAGDRLIVVTGHDAVNLETIQPSGKRPLATAEFLRGYRVEPGQRFGPESLTTSA